MNMYTVFAELPGGSGSLFANLVSGAILLTVRPPQYLSAACLPARDTLLYHSASLPLTPSLQVLNIILLFASFSRLRFSEPELARPYRVPFISRHTSVRPPPPCRLLSFLPPRCQQTIFPGLCLISRCRSLLLRFL